MGWGVHRAGLGHRPRGVPREGATTAAALLLADHLIEGPLLQQVSHGAKGETQNSHGGAQLKGFLQRARCLQFVVAEADPEAASTIALTALARAPASSLFPILIGHQPCPLQRLSLAYRRSFWAANDSSAVVCHPGAATPKAAIQAGRSRECGGSAQPR